MSMIKRCAAIMVAVMIVGAQILLCSCAEEKYKKSIVATDSAATNSYSSFTTDDTTLEAGDISAESNDLALSGAVLVPLAEETGLISLNRWNANVGGLEGWVLDHGAYRFWTGDNALVLWALSKAAYVNLRSQGWGLKLRDYLIDSAFDKGLFTEGKRRDPNSGAITMSSKECSPAMETQVLWGIISYTISFPNSKGQRTADDYRNFISSALMDQHQRIFSGQKGQTCLDGPGINHDFTAPATIAFHIMNLALWSKAQGKPEFETAAAEAWKILAKKQTSAKLFGSSSLRNAQILFTLTRTDAAGVRPVGLVAAKQALAATLRIDQIGRVSFAGINQEPDTDTQSLSYVMMSSANRSLITKAFLANRMCKDKGVFWMGKGGTGTPGPVEDLAMGLLGAWYMQQKAWNTSEAPCQPTQ